MDSTGDIQYFVDKSRWGVILNDCHILIQDYTKEVKMSIELSGDRSWTYAEQDVIEGEYTICRGAEIRTIGITLSVYVHQYKDREKGDLGANIDLVSYSTSTSLQVPYKLAMRLMNFMERYKKIEE